MGCAQTPSLFSGCEFVFCEAPDGVDRVENRSHPVKNSALMAKVNSPVAAGNCRRCHTVSRRSGGGFEFSWLVDR